VEVQAQAFLNLVLDEMSGQLHSPAALPPEVRFQISMRHDI